MESPRPHVSVVVPFYGEADHARQMLAALARLRLGAGDELVVSDNTAAGVLKSLVAPGIVYVAADAVRSSYHARNAGAAAARNDWLLFLDSDCVSGSDLLTEYFSEPMGDRVGAVAGEVVGDREQSALTARYSHSRRHIGQAEIQDHPHRPMAVTANLLVRRAAWQELGGFHEGIRSGGDADFSWRLQDAGWTLEYSARARVLHSHRETLPALLRQSARYGAGMRWLERRHPDATFPSRARQLARCFLAGPALLMTGRLERAVFKGLDALWISANAVGSLASNRHGITPGRDDVVVVTEVMDGAAVDVARRWRTAGRVVRVEAARRAQKPDFEAIRDIPVTYMEDDGPALRLLELAGLVIVHPILTGRDLLHRRELRSGGPRRKLSELAPGARRLRHRGARELRVCGDESAFAYAVRLARISGLPAPELAAAASPAPGSARPQTVMSDKP